MRYLFSLKMFCVWLGSKTQDRTQNPTQNPESKVFNSKPSPKPVVLGLGRKTQKKTSPMPTPGLPQPIYPCQFQDTLLFAARFLWHRLQHTLAPPGVSKVYVLYAFAKIARQVGAFKTARYCYGYEQKHFLTVLIDFFRQLQRLRIPRGPIWEAIQLGAVSIRGKPYRDSDDYQIICPRCGTANGLVNTMGDECNNCQQQFYHSFSNFEPLPLVEFKIDDDLTDEGKVQ